jgi:hypothetical protein
VRHSFHSYLVLTAEIRGGGGASTEKYRITDIGDNYITVEETDEWYNCTETGLKPESYNYSRDINYSIENNVLTIETYDNDIKFNGNSNTIIGTWTRSINKQVSCHDYYYNGEYDGYGCDEYYDVVKAVVTESELAITREICHTDGIKNGEEHRGWKATILDCNNYEVSKGKDKIKVYEDKSSFKITYNGKTCQMKESSRSERESACQKAIAKCSSSSSYYCLEDYYYDFLEEDFKKCFIENEFPAEIFGRDDGDDYEASAKKIMLGKKLLPPR